MQLHQQTITSLMYATSVYIAQEENLYRRDELWVRFFSRLTLEMRELVETVPSMRSLMKAMDHIGIDMSDFVESTRMA